MGKSVYSIVLSDDVVEAIDELAYRTGTNRSGLINSILAERIGCITPEMRMREIFSLVEQELEPRFLTSPQTSGSVLMVKTALRYKYKPTIRYSVELFGRFSECVGRLRVTLRSQSGELTAICADFFTLWETLEKKHRGKYFRGGFPGGAVQKGYTRDFYSAGGEELSDHEIASAITDYIRGFDKALAVFIEAEDTAAALPLCEAVYKSCFDGSEKII